MATDKYGDEINTRKPRRNRVCKYYKGEHVYKLKELHVLNIMRLRYMCDYSCVCGKKKVVSYEKWSKIKRTLTNHLIKSN